MSVNGYWRHLPNGRVLISEKGRQYKIAVMHAVIEQGAPKASGRLDVEITLNPPDRRRRDIDNFQKGLLDSLAEADVFEDDEQIDHLHIHRGECGGEGSAVVTIREIECSS